ARERIEEDRRRGAQVRLRGLGFCDGRQRAGSQRALYGCAGVNVTAPRITGLVGGGSRPLPFPPPLSQERGRPALSETSLKARACSLSRHSPFEERASPMARKGWGGGFRAF